MNWSNILNAMKDFEGFAVFEYENTEDVEEGLNKCLDYITKLL